MDLSLNDDENSVPHLPESNSVGSSVSTDMENECNELAFNAVKTELKLDVNLLDLNLNINTKNNSNLIDLSDSINMKEEDKLLDNNTTTNDNNNNNNNNNDQQQIELNPDKNQLNDDSTSNDIYNKLNNDLVQLNLLRMSILSNQQANEENNLNINEDNNNNDNNFIKLEDMNSNYTNNFTNTTNKNNLNSLTLVSDLQDRTNLDVDSIINKHQDEEEQDLNQKQIDEILNNKMNNQQINSPDSYSSQSASSPSASSYSSQSPSYLNEDNNNININTKNYQYDSFNDDANPRKHSPVPTSPPTNIDLNENEMPSIETTGNHTMIDHNYKRNNIQPATTSTRTNEINQHYDLNKRSTKSQFEQFDINNNLANLDKVFLNHKSLNTNVKIASCLDKWYKELKGQVLSEFEKSRLLIMQDQQKKLIDEKEKQALEISKLKRELDIVRESLKLCERNTLKKDAVIENVTKALEKQREKNDLQRVMMDWKMKRLENAKEAFTTKIADNYYERKLKLKVFLNWHWYLLNKHKAKLEKACKKKAEEVCFDLAKKYESKIKRLDEELTQSRIEIEKYKYEMSKHEENMRKALMRGVCALNLEAMAIFDNDKNGATSSSSSSSSNNNNTTNNNNHNNNNNNNAYMNDMNEHYQESLFFNSKLSFANNNYLNTNKTSSNSTTTTNLAEKELAKKVKSYCETSLKKVSNNELNIAGNNNTNSLSAVAKAKLQLSSINNQQQNHDRFSKTDYHPTTSTYYSNNDQHQNHQQQQQQQQQQKQCSSSLNNRIFSELIQHPDPIQTNKITKKVVKSKIGSLPTSNSVESKQYQRDNIGSTILKNSTMPPYRSIIIEKHTNLSSTQPISSNSNNSNQEFVKYKTTKVQQSHSGHPSNVLNTVITTN